MAASSTPTLTYFDFGGRAELARLLFTFGGIEFIDKRVTGPEFGALKPTLPLGQMPVLEVDGVVYAQSMAIARYAAKRAALYPNDAITALHVDVVSETLNDLVEDVTQIFFRTSDSAEKQRKADVFAADTVPKFLAALEKLVRGAFFAGDSATLADIQLLEVVENGLKPFVPALTIAPYPKLAKVLDGVYANEHIAAYLSSSSSK